MVAAGRSDLQRGRLFLDRVRLAELFMVKSGWSMSE